jgi:hypothetical protein
VKRRAAFGAETCDSPERVFWPYGESVRELAVQQRFLTEDEISDARAMIGWQFWAAPLIFGFASLGLGIGAIGGNPVIIFVFLLVFSAAVLLCLSRVSDFKKVSHDIEMRVAEVIEGAPEKVWVQRGVCYVVLAGRTIRVPPDAHVFGSLREANIVKIAFLPTALVALHVESDRGLGI